MKIRYLTLLILSFILFLSACKEEGQETDYNPNVKSSKEFIFSEDILFEVINIYLKGITDTAVLGEGYNYVDNCGILYIPLDDKMTFEYGGVNRWCPDNKFRRGSFDAFINGPFFTQGTRVDFVFDSLFVNDNLVEGILSSVFLGTDNSGKHQLGFQMSQGMITLNDTVNESIIHFETDYVLTWEEGYGTPTVHEDDMFMVTGTASGRNLDQVDYELTIQDPLMNYLDCFWIVSGMHRIDVPSAVVPEGTIDYITTDECFYHVKFYFAESEFYEYLTH
jgi:hypothetical protein